jgi:hypothetical protein
MEEALLMENRNIKRLSFPQIQQTQDALKERENSK